MEKRLGVYIHIPFCASKCSYCDFYSRAGCEGLMPKYQQAVITHIQEATGQLSHYLTDSVYFGGGTPSYYGARRIVELLDQLKRCGRLLKSAEITVEANPDSVRPRDLAMLRRAGVNRLSLGVQAADDDLLKLIGRRHNFRQAEQAVKNARDAGFDNISVDLIYGLPSQNPRDWAETLARTCELRPDHISCYGLELKEGTPMYEDYKGSVVLPSDDDQADMYLYMVEYLERLGYHQYEISNFALEGRESRHNLKYWNLEDYMAFGSAAHGCMGNVRYSYVADMQAYIDGISSGGSVLADYEEIGRLDRAAEYIMLGMRRAVGISAAEYMRIYPSDFAPLEELFAEYERKGWAVRSGDRWHFTPTGFLISNTLIGALLEAQAEEKVAFNPWSRGAFDSVVDKTELPEGDERFLREHGKAGD